MYFSRSPPVSSSRPPGPAPARFPRRRVAAILFAGSSGILPARTPAAGTGKGSGISFHRERAGVPAGLSRPKPGGGLNKIVISLDGLPSASVARVDHRQPRWRVPMAPLVLLERVTAPADAAGPPRASQGRPVCSARRAPGGGTPALFHYLPGARSHHGRETKVSP